MNLFKRAGWVSYHYETFVEVVPLDDTKDHLLGDECWCDPRVEYEDNSLPLIIHNALDGRE